MKALIAFFVSLNFANSTFSQVENAHVGAICSQTIIPSIIIKCVFDKEIGWHQEASLETEQLEQDCSIDSIQLVAFGADRALDTIFKLSSNQIQINPDKKDCWSPGFLKAKMSFFQKDIIVAEDTFAVQISLLDNAKKCACGSLINGNKMSKSVGFGKVSLAYDVKRNRAEKIGLDKKKYSSEFTEYNYDKGKIIKVDKLSKSKGKIYIDESHLSTGFSRNNNFPEAKYRVIKKENALIFLMAESRREDGDLLIWKVVIQGTKIDIIASWYRDGEIRTTYIVQSN